MSALRGAEREALYRFARMYVRPTALGRDEAARFDRTLWVQLAATEVFRTAVEGDVGAAARAFAGLAHGGLDVPLGLSAVAQWIGVHLLAKFGGAEVRTANLERLIDGRWIVAVCNAEPHAGTDLRAMRSRVDPDGAGGHVATIHKSSASNLSAADVAIVSLWVAREEPELAVIVVPARAPLVQTAHVERLAGFRTGLTGGLDSPVPLPVPLDEVRLGSDGGAVLRRCFDLERVLIGALLQGCVDGLLDECCEHLRGREIEDPQVVRHQYVQDKLATIFTLARRIEGIVGLAATSELAGCGDLLSAAKMTAVEDSLLAATTAYELFGYAGYLRASFVQKAHRDLLAFKLLGGTRELMKITLFRELKARWGREPG